MMPGDDEWLKVQEIIASVTTEAAIDLIIIHHAKIMLYLICHKAKKGGMPEESIRWLYSEFAEMAITEFNRSGSVPFWN